MFRLEKRRLHGESYRSLLALKRGLIRKTKRDFIPGPVVVGQGSVILN